MDERKPTIKVSPISAGNARRAAAKTLRGKTLRSEADNIASALLRIPRAKHRQFALNRIAGMDKDVAYKAAGYKGIGGSTLDAMPLIQSAIVEGMKGSAMTAVQIRDYVKDRLVIESQGDISSSRIRAVELLGKTCDMFGERQVTEVKGQSEDIENKIAALLQRVKERDVTSECQRIPDDQQCVTAHPDQSEGHSNDAVGSANQGDDGNQGDNAV